MNFENEVLNAVNGEPNEDLVECEGCGQMLPRREVASNVLWIGSHQTDMYICDDCIDGENYYWCELCGHVHGAEEEEDEAIYAYDWRHNLVTVCPYCAEEHVRECDDCGEMFLISAIREDDFGNAVCEDCYEDHWVTCEECGRLVSNDDAECYDDMWYCPDCYERVARTNRVRRYHDRPDMYFYATAEDHEDGSSAYECSQKAPYYGIELEIDEGNRDTCDFESCADELYRLTNDESIAYMNHDGSLSDEGIEFITMPCTLRYHLTEFPWSKMTDIAYNNGYRSHDACNSCGLHVHVDRRAFGDDYDERESNLAKVIILVDKFWDQMVRFSRRNMYALSRWAKKPDMEATNDDTESKVHEKYQKYVEGYDRYRAVNLQNRKTVEFRLFRGTLNTNTIKATLEMVDNLIKFATDHDLKAIQMCSFEDVTNYHEYDELKRYLGERHLADPVDIDAVTEENAEDEDSEEEV